MGVGNTSGATARQTGPAFGVLKSTDRTISNAFTGEAFDVVRRRGKQRVCIWSEAGGDARPKTERNRRALPTRRGVKANPGITGVMPAGIAEIGIPISAGVAPGPHHSLSPNPAPMISFPPRRRNLPRLRSGLFFAVAKVAPASPSSDRRNLAIAANGDALPGCLAYQLRQSGLPYSFDDLPNDSAQRLPTDRHCVVLVSIHKPELMDRSRQCLMEQLTENFGSHGSEKFFQ